MTAPHYEKQLEEQRLCIELRNEGYTNTQISEKTGLTRSAVQRRIASYTKAERLDPELKKRLNEEGIVDLAGLHSGWLMNKTPEGSGQSLYFFLGKDEQIVNLAELIKETLSDIAVLPPITPATDGSADLMNAMALADLHVGENYGDPAHEETFNWILDDVISRLPKAQKAVLVELGDLLEANDHKGETPGSSNRLDVNRENYFSDMQAALRMMKRAIARLAETHAEVEVHLIRGNHDPSAYLGIMMALEEHFSASPHITIVQSDEEFRVIQWGQCAIFPNHGDKMTWPQLKDVWSERFPDEWAEAKAVRAIWTGHFHHDRKRDLIGAEAEHFRTLAAPNTWARHKGLFSRGSLTAVTFHKEAGETDRTKRNIKPTRGARDE